MFDVNRRARNFLTMASRFGWIRAGEVLLLWAARRVFGYRSAVIYWLELDRTPKLRDCDRLEWRYLDEDRVETPLRSEQPATTPNPSARRYFIGTLHGVQCYSSVVSNAGFNVPDRIRVSFKIPTEAYVGDCITLAGYRGLGIYPCGLSQLARRLQAEGTQRLYLFVERDNLPSIRSVLKAGFTPVATTSVCYLGTLAWRNWHFVGDARDHLAKTWDIQRIEGPGVSVH